MGVRTAWVKEQHTAPAREYREYSPRPLGVSKEAAMDDFKSAMG
jgi:hypothetical protein